MATQDTVVQELVVNTLTHKQFKAAQEAGTLSPYELYGTPDTSARLPILTPMWFDHIANDVSWLRADTFSWQSGDVYVAAYEHLLADFEGTTADTETVAGIEITYYSAQDGHKICLPDQESKISALYEATGVAWYYILDTDNKQFKLPRTKWGFTGLRDSVGNYVEPGLPLPTSTFSMHSGGGGGTSGFVGNTYTYQRSQTVTANTDSIYGNSTTVQPPATQMYLYFYVGNFEQDSVEQTAGINAEMFNSKADVDLGNIPANYDYVVESQLPTADNGYTWYRKYKSGWVEQGGVVDAKRTAIVFPIEMSDTNYTYSLSAQSFGASNYDPCISNVFPDTLATTGFTIINQNHSSVEYERSTSWQVSGMAAQ